ncbi:thiamine phosphate synthase [Phycisphaera mikurensis]|uniref:thiamine phosphate synthase n=1 Tax=Phycisphaera mikurensis TaxID=547188 RepID=UPI00059ED774|nr:thiamine phosphate synthase [Phycisphaera mikurensis]
MPHREDRGPLRILDANANRAREALRVMEEAARFLLDDSRLAGTLKSDRHALRAALAGAGDLAAGRDVGGDVGRTLTTPAEGERDTVVAVVAAAGGRASEALRALEEYGKAVPGVDAAAIEAIRYRGYAVAAELATRLRVAAQAKDRRAQLQAHPWRVCVLLDRAACRLPWERLLAAVLDAGADAIQVREKQTPSGPLLAHAREVVRRVERRAAVVVNDRPDLALLSGADGVHLGQDDVGVADARRVLGPAALVGVSTTSLCELAAAVADGADTVGLGPMFPTATKPGKAVAGVAYAEAALRRHPGLPHLAIGGITPANAGGLAAAGVRGVAVAASVTGAADPAAAVHGLLEALAA